MSASLLFIFLFDDFDYSKFEFNEPFTLKKQFFFKKKFFIYFASNQKTKNTIAKNLKILSLSIFFFFFSLNLKFLISHFCIQINS